MDEEFKLIGYQVKANMRRFGAWLMNSTDTRVDLLAISGQDAAQEFCRALERSHPGAVIAKKRVAVMVQNEVGLISEYMVDAWVQPVYHARLVG